MRILIPSYVEDIHARAVAMALEQKGHEPVLWFTADFPTRQTSSIRIAPGGESSWRASGSELDVDEHSPFDVVWFRRPTQPELPEDLHPGDRYLAQRACNSHHVALWELVSPDAFWVNPHQTRRRATIKPRQLIEAGRVGLSVPLTLCSNDPEDIRCFLAEHEGEIVYKPFSSAQWRTDDGSALVFTSAVGLEDLPEDDILRLSSGIFQRRVPKAHELRVLYLGGAFLTAKLRSQEHPDAELDWKLAFRDLGVEPAAPLPPEVAASCRALMERLGLVFGCFDFVVTPEGEYVFLEVNEMGQFLWLEEGNPELLVLDVFCEFLVHAGDGFDGRPADQPVRYGDIEDEALAQIEERRQVHVPKIFRQAADDTGRSPDGVARIATPV